jgi:hypothetical protein
MVINVTSRGGEFSATAFDEQASRSPFRGIDVVDFDPHGAEGVHSGKTVLAGEETIDLARPVGERGHHDGPVGNTLVSGDAEFHPDGPAPFDLEF